MGVYFAQDVGNIVSNIFQKFIPVLLFASVVIGPPVPHSLWSLVMFIISMILGFLILWFISAIFGLLAFWLIDLGPIGGVKHYIVRFLSGSFIPLWFFPQGIADAMRFFPFMYIYQSPISIFLGKSSVLEAFLILFTQLIWVGILFLCCYSLQRKAFRNVVVQGG
jgi:ABC-2 type transport system permease protein